MTGPSSPNEFPVQVKRVMAVGKETGPFVEEEEQEILLHLPQIPAREEQHTGVRGGFMGVEAI